MKRTIHVLALLLLGVCMTSCQQKNERWDNNAYRESILQGESIRESETFSFEKPWDYIYKSISDFCINVDPNRSEGTAYQEAIAAYDKAIGQDTESWLRENDLADSFDVMRMAIAYIDPDDIPEILVCFSNHTITGMHIFTYLPGQKEVVHIGCFSSSGAICYLEKGNVILSQYGNQGYYRLYRSRISKDGTPELIDTELWDGTGNKHDDIAIYRNFPIPQELQGLLDGSREGFARIQEKGLSANFDIGEEYRVANDNADEPESDQGNYIEVRYDKMFQVTLQSGGIRGNNAEN